MDEFLIDYLISGKCYVLIGSGPSCQMGYPSWRDLASSVANTVKIEGHGSNLKALNKALEMRNYPQVFEQAKRILGGPRLLQILNEKMKSSETGTIYELIARWPVPVYLTTNYDDEIQKQFAQLNESYGSYSNSKDHMAHLLPGLDGAIFKLHGDLRSESGLILTSSQYKEIDKSDEWHYWRTKMTSIFQLCRVVVIGHSLTDENIRHVLETAKQGAGVLQPICWIAPDARPGDRRELLEKYRIRVISYDNQDGKHTNLLRLIENISNFVPPRTSISIQEEINRISQSPLGKDSAAPGFFVFNKLLATTDIEFKRPEIILAAIQSSFPKLASLGEFTLDNALEHVGWPTEIQLGSTLEQQICKLAIDEGLFVQVENKFKLSDNAVPLSKTFKNSFDHMRERFINSLLLRIARMFPTLSQSDASMVADDIEASLAGYFREGGLTLATILFSSQDTSRQITVPSSIIKFINESSARYNDLLKRQAFSNVSVDIFVNPGSAEKKYLGRISHGFFCFHALGIFGEVAYERLKNAKETVWLVDSNSQIPALALGAPTHSLFKGCFSDMYNAGVKFFTTDKLFDETREHLWFANNLINQYGESSPSVIAAAKGQAPYYKQNQFLEGFVRWRAAGNPCDWPKYLFEIFGTRTPNDEDIKDTLQKIGIMTVDLKDWPGFCDENYIECDNYVENIVKVCESTMQTSDKVDSFKKTDPYKKAQPEGEALMIVKRERSGDYYVLSECGKQSPAWFITSTSLLNKVEPGAMITWRPEAFLSFTSTLTPTTEVSESQAFESILFAVSLTGKSLLSEEIIENIFGDVIDQVSLEISEQREVYQSTLAQKYGDSPEHVIKSVKPSYRLITAVQIANEMALLESTSRLFGEKKINDLTDRLKKAEDKLKDLEKYRRKKIAKKTKKVKRKNVDKRKRRKKRKKKRKKK